MPHITLLLTRLGQRLLNRRIYADLLDDLRRLREGSAQASEMGFHFATARLMAMLLLVPMCVGSLALASGDPGWPLEAASLTLLVLPFVYLLWTTVAMRAFPESGSALFQPTTSLAILDALVPVVTVLGCVLGAGVDRL